MLTFFSYFDFKYRTRIFFVGRHTKKTIELFSLVLTLTYTRYLSNIVNVSKNLLFTMVMGLNVTIIVFTYCLYQVNENLISLRSEIDSSTSAIPKPVIPVNAKMGHSITSVTEINGTKFPDDLSLQSIPDSFEAHAQQSDQEEIPQANPLLQNNTMTLSLLNNAFVPDASSVLSVIIRTTIIATLVFLIVKWLGGKGIGQLSPFGLLIVVGLGSAIGDPMIYKEISIPQAMAAVIIVVVFFKAIDYLTLKSKRFRNSMEPKPITLVEYGSIEARGLKAAKMDFEEFEVQMRLNGIENVDEIKFARLEPNGQVSFILKRNTNPPGC